MRVSFHLTAGLVVIGAVSVVAVAVAQPPGWPGMRPPGAPSPTGMHGPGMHGPGMRPPGTMPTGMPGMPPGMSNPGMPGSPTMPGSMPTMPGSMPGSMPGMQPPGIPEHRLPSMPDLPRGPMFEMVYTCTSCGKELGRGTQPDLANCPHCGVRFDNTVSGMLANSREQTQAATGWNASSTTGSGSSSGGYNRVRIPGKLIGFGIGIVVMVVGGLVAVVKGLSGSFAPKRKVRKVKKRTWDDD